MKERSVSPPRPLLPSPSFSLLPLRGVLVFIVLALVALLVLLPPLPIIMPSCFFCFPRSPL